MLSPARTRLYGYLTPRSSSTQPTIVARPELSSTLVCSRNLPADLRRTRRSRHAHLQQIPPCDPELVRRVLRVLSTRSVDSSVSPRACRPHRPRGPVHVLVLHDDPVPQPVQLRPRLLNCDGPIRARHRFPLVPRSYQTNSLSSHTAQSGRLNLDACLTISEQVVGSRNARWGMMKLDC